MKKNKIKEKKSQKREIISSTDDSGRNMILYAVFALVFAVFLIDLLTHTIGLV